jgi:hypothetical protein
MPGSSGTGVITPERFASATTFDQYVAQMKVNQERMLQYVDEVEVPDEDLAWWRSRGKLNVYVLTFDGCGDALYNIPVMAKIAKLCPNIDLRVVQRDENLDVMDAYLNRGLYRSVPTFIFLDESFQEIGTLKERPESLTEIVEQEMIRVRRRLREENKVAWRGELARELRTVVEKRKRYP